MRRLLYAVTVLGALTSAAGALASLSDREQHKFNAADQAAAKQAVVLKTDLQNTGWTGGVKKPDLSPGPTCANFDPKQSDLVLTGAAETDWKHTNLELDTVAQVLQSSDMVEKDWQRTVADPAALPCTKLYVEKNVGSAASEKFVSMTRIPFPSVGTHARAYVTRIDVTLKGKTGPVLIEDVLLTKGRTEISLSSTTPGAYAVAVAEADIALAKLLVARAKA
jgi:hypothetical protein